MRTINKKKEFIAVLRDGRSKTYRNLVVRYQQQGYEDVAFGFSLPRKLGGSVVRNRARRRMKEAVRKQEGEFPAGRYLFLARNQLLRAGFHEIEEDLVSFFGEMEHD